MPVQKVAVLGGSGLVGSRLRELWTDVFELTAPPHAELDVLDDAALEHFVATTNADTVVNLVAWADVDGAEPESGNRHGRVYALNVDLPRRLAQLCEHSGKHLVHISTDYVFDGTREDRPYVEDDATHALCWYAQTKLDGELAVREVAAAACIARIEMPFTARDHAKRDLVRTLAARLQSGQPIQGVVDQRITPVLLDDAAAALEQLVRARFAGTIHVAPTDWTTPFEFARSVASRLRLPLDQLQLQAIEFEDFARTRTALRPRHSWLDVTRFTQQFGAGILRSVEAELDTWAAQR